ncbi:hypothetical protein SLEP1_g49595 [Rubroshorea leprosula]|uniref:Uncharacterized protein n=1 Tax=Rubroshorea leprosula TaxID=152421 RepID=A0AAV5LXB9_9ROSI|nr:hypothetical protein SLEP1_g49595 [Rubroshorea leprosula]
MIIDARQWEFVNAGTCRHWEFVKHWYFCNPANGVKHWLLLTPASGSLLNTGTIIDACQWEFVKHWYFCNPANGVKHWLLLTPANGRSKTEDGETKGSDEVEP